MKTRILIFLLFFFQIDIFHNYCNAQDFDVDKEMSRLRKEMSKITADMRRVQVDREKDQKEFTEYQSRIKNTIISINTEIDSTKNLIESNQKSRDSISAELASFKSSKKEFDLLQEDLRNQLIKNCDTFAKTARTFPPLVTNSLNASILFLKSELTAKSVDNIEAINRLSQIADDMEEIVSGIQVLQESSPIPDIRGTVYRIRLGAIYEALIEERGSKAALWTGYDSNGKAMWQIIASDNERERLLKAIQIREGKSLPDFVELPFVSTASDTGGVK